MTQRRDTASRYLNTEKSKQNQSLQSVLAAHPSEPCLTSIQTALWLSSDPNFACRSSLTWFGLLLTYSGTLQLYIFLFYFTHDSKWSVFLFLAYSSVLYFILTKKWKVVNATQWHLSERKELISMVNSHQYHLHFVHLLLFCLPIYCFVYLSILPCLYHVTYHVDCDCRQECDRHHLPAVPRVADEAKPVPPSFLSSSHLLHCTSSISLWYQNVQDSPSAVSVSGEVGSKWLSEQASKHTTVVDSEYQMTDTVIILSWYWIAECGTVLSMLPPLNFVYIYLNSLSDDVKITYEIVFLLLNDEDTHQPQHLN